MRKHDVLWFGILVLAGCSTAAIPTEEMPTPQEVVSCVSDADCTIIPYALAGGCGGNFPVNKSFVPMLEAHRAQFGLGVSNVLMCGQSSADVMSTFCQDNICMPVCTSNSQNHEQVPCGESYWPPKEWPKVE